MTHKNSSLWNLEWRRRKVGREASRIPTVFMYEEAILC